MRLCWGGWVCVDVWRLSLWHRGPSWLRLDHDQVDQETLHLVNHCLAMSGQRCSQMGFPSHHLAMNTQVLVRDFSIIIQHNLQRIFKLSSSNTNMWHSLVQNLLACIDLQLLLVLTYNLFQWDLLKWRLTLMFQFRSSSFTNEREHWSQTPKHAIKETFLTGSSVDVTGGAGRCGGWSIKKGRWGRQVTYCSGRRTAGTDKWRRSSDSVTRRVGRQHHLYTSIVVQTQHANVQTASLVHIHSCPDAAR